MLVCTPTQLVYLLENQVVELIILSLSNQFSLDSLHLGLKMVKKILLLLQGLRQEFTPERMQEIYVFTKIQALYSVSLFLQTHRDPYVKEEGAKIKMLI